jgi:aldehyde dehydrogenase family 7 protein A1
VGVQFLERLGLGAENDGCFTGSRWCGSGEVMASINPATGRVIAHVRTASAEELEESLANCKRSQREWALTPAPKRGEIVRQIGEALRACKEDLGDLISLEMGKIKAEGAGEVQEIIDICDYAAGLSRMIYGKVIPSERREHVLHETWHPLGTVGIITAFNFPAAVAGWNFALSLVCGNTNIWKGHESTNLVTVALTRIVSSVLSKNGVEAGVFACATGAGRVVGEALLRDKRVNLVSFTGSTGVGRHVAQVVQERFGKVLLELGGNNAAVITPTADLKLALASCVFGAVGTAGQRCTSLRRLILHESIADKFLADLVRAYKSVPIGDPLDPKTLVGPVHGEVGLKIFDDALREAQAQGGKVLVGGRKILREGFFVQPTIIELPKDAPLLQEEHFCPVLFVVRYSTLAEAIAINNSVPQGLSSAIFTSDMKEVFEWTGPTGTDCGLSGVNTGTSGAEISGAFGGEKATGGGRESGSDSWKQYMRRLTATINYSSHLPLAQGIKFGSGDD